MAVLTSVLVLGPTGGVGKATITELLRRAQEFHRIAAFCNLERQKPDDPSFKELESKGVEVVKGTFDDVDAFKGFDVVIAALGNHGLKEQPRIIDTAVAAGVRHFYPSEFGADITVPGNWEMRYYRDKVITREHLQKKAKDIPGFGYTYFINGRFSEWAIIPHFGIFPKTHEAFIFGNEGNKQSLLPLSAAAQYLVATLLVPIVPGVSERTYRFVENNYTYGEIIDTLQRVQGVRYKVTYKDVEEARVKEAKAREIGDVNLELEASHQLIQGTGRTIVPGPYDNDKFPQVVPEDLYTTLKRVFADTSAYPLLEMN